MLADKPAVGEIGHMQAHAGASLRCVLVLLARTGQPHERPAAQLSPSSGFLFVRARCYQQWLGVNPSCRPAAPLPDAARHGRICPELPDQQL